MVRVWSLAFMLLISVDLTNKTRVVRVGKKVRAKEHVMEWMHSADPTASRPLGSHYTTVAHTPRKPKPQIVYASEGNRFISNNDL